MAWGLARLWPGRTGMFEVALPPSEALARILAGANRTTTPFDIVDLARSDRRAASRRELATIVFGGRRDAGRAVTSERTRDGVVLRKRDSGVFRFHAVVHLAFRRGGAGTLVTYSGQPEFGAVQVVLVWLAVPLLMLPLLAHDLLVSGVHAAEDWTLLVLPCLLLISGAAAAPLGLQALRDTQEDLLRFARRRLEGDASPLQAIADG